MLAMRVLCITTSRCTTLSYVLRGMPCVWMHIHRVRVIGIPTYMTYMARVKVVFQVFSIAAEKQSQVTSVSAGNRPQTKTAEGC